jgi:hypothetical protein
MLGISEGIFNTRNSLILSFSRQLIRLRVQPTAQPVQVSAGKIAIASG